MLRSVITQSVRPPRAAPTPYQSRFRHRPRASRALDRRPWSPAAGADAPGHDRITGLTKRLGGRTVVDDVSFRCEPGTVTGFLGPNGAGKTTTMRMLVRAVGARRRHGAVLGGRYRDLPTPGRRVGILLDAAAQHAGRRGREALAVSAQMMGVDPRRVDGLLDRVGLDRSAARKRVRHYSLGMRQRLGLAHALLGDPEVLILDEPANGLDPEGMRWMRELLRDFADRGGTVLLSSHLLHEVEALADRLVIIGVGRIVAAGLARRAAGGRRHARARRRRGRAASRLSTPPAFPHGRPATAASSSTPSTRPSVAPPSPAASRSAASDRRRAPGLEQLFFDLTRGGEPPTSGGGPMSVPAALALPVAGLDHDRRPGLARLTASSCARWSTPARASGSSFSTSG